MAAERRFFITVEMMIAKTIMTNAITNTATIMPTSRENPGAVAVSVVVSVDRKERTLFSIKLVFLLSRLHLVGLVLSEAYSNVLCDHLYMCIG